MTCAMEIYAQDAASSIDRHRSPQHVAIPSFSVKRTEDFQEKAKAPWNAALGDAEPSTTHRKQHHGKTVMLHKALKTSVYLGLKIFGWVIELWHSHCTNISPIRQLLGISKRRHLLSLDPGAFLLDHRAPIRCPQPTLQPNQDTNHVTKQGLDQTTTQTTYHLKHQFIWQHHCSIQKRIPNIGPMSKLISPHIQNSMLHSHTHPYVLSPTTKHQNSPSLPLLRGSPVTIPSSSPSAQHQTGTKNTLRKREIRGHLMSKSTATQLYVPVGLGGHATYHAPSSSSKWSKAQKELLCHKKQKHQYKNKPGPYFPPSHSTSFLPFFLSPLLSVLFFSH